MSEGSGSEREDRRILVDLDSGEWVYVAKKDGMLVVDARLNSFGLMQYLERAASTGNDLVRLERAEVLIESSADLQPGLPLRVRLIARSGSTIGEIDLPGRISQATKVVLRPDPR